MRLWCSYIFSKNSTSREFDCWKYHWEIGKLERLLRYQKCIKYLTKDLLLAVKDTVGNKYLEIR